MLQKVGHAKLNKFCFSMKAQQRKFDLETSKSAILPWEVSMKKSTYAFLPLLGLAFLAGVSGVQAATISVGAIGYLTYNDADGTVVGYTGLPAPGDVSSSYATVFSLENYGAGTEADKMNSLAGTSFSGVDKLEPAPSAFTIDTEYFAVKDASGNQDKGIAFFRILSGSPVTFTMYSDAALTQPLQVSHVSQFVPIPAAAYLFGSALLGMAGIGYSRNKKQV